MTPVGRQTGYQDPPALELEGIVDLDDPLERTAIAMHRMTFATPEDVVSMLSGAHGRDDLERSWKAQEPAVRKFWRIRADVAVTAHTGAER